jgi:peptide/nickel transport system substrate-binding protein
MTRRHLVQQGLGAASLLLLGLAERAGAQGASSLTIAMGDEPNTFDIPFYSTSPLSHSAVGLVEEGLAYIDEHGALKPLLAEAWNVSGDGRTWTFRLKRGVQFHDGTPFNAEAVKFTFDRILADKDPITDKKALNAFVFTGVTEIRATDDYTLQMTTKDKFAPLVRNVAYGGGVGIESPAAVKKMGTGYGLHPVGTGPYRLTQLTKGERIVLQRNSGYWGGGTGVDTITFRIIPDASARTLGLMSGDYDVIGDVPPEQVPQLRRARGTGVIAQPVNRMIWLIPDVRDASPLSKPPVRRAVNLAINRETMVKDALFGFAKPAYTILSPLTPGYASVGQYPYNPSDAKRMLAQAGYPNGFAIKLVYAPYVPQSQAVSEAVQGYLQEIGVRVELTHLEQATYWSSMRDASDKYGLWLFAWGPGNADADTLLSSTFSSTSIPVYNVGAYSNADLDKLIAQQRSTLDPNERGRIIGQILKYIYEQDLAIPLFNQEALIGIKLGVKGMWISPNGTLGLDRVTVGS